MTRVGIGLLPVLLLSLICGFSMGSPIYYLVALMLALMYLFALISVFVCKKGLKVSCLLQNKEILRGQSALLKVELSNRCLLPVSDFIVRMRCGGIEDTKGIQVRMGGKAEMSITIPGTHVGTYPVSVERVETTDVFGLMRVNYKLGVQDAMMVLPRPFDIEKPEFAQSDEGNAALGRTQEDYTSPEDVRSYRPGDAMKRIHWKLSSRKHELLVRRFEVPTPPDTLILLDTVEPVGGGDKPEGTQCLRDALCETAVAVAGMQLKANSPIRVPFYGQQANEFAAASPENLSLLQEMIAMQPFSGAEKFVRVLQLETRRMRRTGATIVITSEIDAGLVDAVAGIRRQGPAVRLYLVTYQPEDEAIRPYVTQLQHHLVEVCYVTPTN